MKIAQYVRDIVGWRGRASLYKLNVPMEGYDWSMVPNPELGIQQKQPTTHQYVIVSAVGVMYTGPETYIFASDADGEVLDWSELPGSYRGGLDHAVALASAGYEIGTFSDPVA